METKVAKHFSKPLMKQNIKSNMVLIIVITLIMVMMSTVINFAMSKMTDSSLGYEELTETEDKTAYDNMFAMMGMDPDRMEMMSTMDPTAMLNRMYYTVMAILPIMILFVFLANSLIVDQVDKGSMAYVLSTPTKRSAVTGTQTLFLVMVPFVVLSIVCVSRIISTKVFFGEVNAAGMLALFGGMYILVEAMAAICYMGSCIFNRSRASLAFGGGISVWFFIASLLGMFGTDMMVNMGVGVKELGNLNKMTLIGLYDIDALATVGTDAMDDSFVWKLLVLAVIAVICYMIGSLRFQKKDLPL